MPTHTTSLPGYLRLLEVADALGMSRQNFRQSGLAGWLPHWQLAKNVVLYRQDDVALLHHWLHVRQGLIALDLRPGGATSPLVPTDGEWNAAVHEGYWDTGCPGCGSDLAVGEPLATTSWCPDCGVVENAQ